MFITVIYIIFIMKIIITNFTLLSLVEILQLKFTLVSRSLVVSDLRSEAKGFRFEFGC